MVDLAHQDWKPVTLHRNYTASETLKKAQRTGTSTSVEKQTTQGVSNSKKLDNETETFNIVK